MYSQSELIKLWIQFRSKYGLTDDKWNCFGFSKEYENYSENVLLETLLDYKRFTVMLKK